MEYITWTCKSGSSFLDNLSFNSSNWYLYCKYLFFKKRNCSVEMYLRSLFERFMNWGKQKFTSLSKSKLPSMVEVAHFCIFVRSRSVWVKLQVNPGNASVNIELVGFCTTVIETFNVLGIDGHTNFTFIEYYCDVPRIIAYKIGRHISFWINKTLLYIFLKEKL